MGRIADEAVRVGRRLKAWKRYSAAAAKRRSAGTASGAVPPTAPPKQGLPSDYDPETKRIIGRVRPYTMTSPEKLNALIASVRYLERAKISGALVECGVWRGGSMHAVARALHNLGAYDRELYLFDTFTGMTEPTVRDISIGRNRSAADLLETSDKTAHVWAVASIEDVQAGLETLPYPIERFHLVAGPVEQTIPEQAPDQIALLRLDTDWYESTKHELEHLYDRLQPGGVLIIDDYGSWQGAKEATDEFLGGLPEQILMLRAGRSRVGVKPGR